MAAGPSARCPRCDRELRPDGKCPSCDERGSGRVGDATRGRIDRLEPGWDISKATPSPTPTLPKGARKDPTLDIDSGVDIIHEEEAPTQDEREIVTVKTPTIEILDQLEAESKDEEDDEDETEEHPTFEKDPPPKKKPPLKAKPPPIPASGPEARIPTAQIEPKVIVSQETLPLPMLPLKAREDDTAFDNRSEAPHHEHTPEPEKVYIRRGGLFGDLRYVLAVMNASISGRREVSSMRERLGFERAARARRLGELAKNAMGDPRLDGPALSEARGNLKRIDEDRERHQKLAVELGEEAKRADQAREKMLAALNAENVDLAAKIAKLEANELAPLEGKVAGKKKAFEDLKGGQAEVQKRIGLLEKRLAKATVSEPGSRADVEADLAAARAERQALLRDEPTTAGAVTELEPKLEAVRKKLDDLRAAIKKNKEESAREEDRLLLSAKAARARQAEAERARKATDAARELEFVSLGEAIDRERPDKLLLRLRPADEHAAAIAILERRILELEDAMRAVDRATVIRGILWLILISAAVFTAVWFILRI